MKIDLHNHTKYSDGLFSPEELIKIAISQNVDCFALTDHDSVAGCDEIQEISKNYNIKVISGMELSTYYKGKSVHIVCLFPNNKVPEGLIEYTKNMKNERDQRAIQMMKNIESIYGLKVDIDKLFSGDGVITRANMLYNIAECNNMTHKEVEPYISNDSKAYIPSTKLDVRDGIEMAKECGCLTILAHPCLLPKEYAVEIAKMGVDGIEVRYPSNATGDEQFFSKLADEIGLLKSGGSDFHGDDGSKHAMIGTSTIDENMFKPIKERLGLEWK